MTYASNGWWRPRIASPPLPLKFDWGGEKSGQFQQITKSAFDLSEKFPCDLLYLVKDCSDLIYLFSVIIVIYSLKNGCKRSRFVVRAGANFGHVTWSQGGLGGNSYPSRKSRLENMLLLALLL